jgi:hypothetical protein
MGGNLTLEEQSEASAADKEEKQQDSEDQEEEDEESRQYAQVKAIRKKYVKKGLYFYYCNNCPGFQILSQKHCSYCKLENSYYDHKLTKLPDIKSKEKDLMEELYSIVEDKKA